MSEALERAAKAVARRARLRRQCRCERCTEKPDWPERADRDADKYAAEHWGDEEHMGDAQAAIRACLESAPVVEIFTDQRPFSEDECDDTCGLYGCCPLMKTNDVGVPCPGPNCPGPGTYRLVKEPTP